jgi:hypothetical protein
VCPAENFSPAGFLLAWRTVPESGSRFSEKTLRKA